MRIPLYLRFAIILLLGLSALIVGTTYINFRIWRDVARGYGLSNLEKKLENGLERKNWDPADWAFLVEKQDQKGRWLNAPSGLSPKDSEILAGYVLQQVRASKTKEGSFELAPQNDAHSLPRYFVSFRAEPERLLVLGTLDHLNLASLSPWAIPYLSIFAGSYGLAFLLALGLSFYVSSSYRQLNQAIERIGAGRLDGVKLPESRDPDLSLLSLSISKLASLLNQRDTELAKVSQLANEDPLTKLPNFRAFRAAFEKAPSEQGDTSSNWISILDLDYFKKVNDQLGHLCGDEALRAVGSLLRARQIPGTFAARYGGEEFVVLLRAQTQIEAADYLQMLMNGLRQAKIVLPEALAKDVGRSDFQVTASFGLAPVKSGETLESALAKADKALYRAKKRGRNRICMNEPEDKEWT
jgi:diguanylate cyclase (GGDEF)-like protein